VGKLIEGRLSSISELMPDIPVDAVMQRPRRWWQQVFGWRYLGLCIIVLSTVAMHLSVIMFPNEPVFDEQFYVNDAKRISQGLGSERTEHPPLGKLFVLTGIRVFGDNPFGWRFFSVVFGTAIIILFYFICRRLRLPEKTTLLATFLLAFENMSFVQSGIVMLDVYMLGLCAAAFLFYLHDEYAMSGLLIGISTLTKLSGALGLVVIVLHWLLVRRDRKLHFSLSMLLAPISFIVLLPLFNYFIDGKLVNPFHLIDIMWQGTSSLTFDWVTHPAASRPWTWIINNHEIYYWIKPRYMGTLSYTIWALIIPSTVYMIYRGLRNNIAALFGLSWVVGTYYIWMPVVLITNRVTYPFYIYPAVGALCIGIAQGLTHLLDMGKSRWAGKWYGVMIGVVIVICLGHAAAFVFMSPVFTRQW
jgi:dolichyl-phosphate-mannose-protein mannosyltransferase